MIVLGIDAAWTATEPSGVAVVVGDAGRWTCRGVAPSYCQFHELAAGQPTDWTQRPPAGAINVKELLSSAEALVGSIPDVIAVDMPLARSPISGDFKIVRCRWSGSPFAHRCEARTDCRSAPSGLGAARLYARRGLVCVSTLACSHRDLPTSNHDVGV